MNEPLTKEQITDVLRFFAPGCGIEEVCDSHELLRARLEAAEKRAETAEARVVGLDMQVAKTHALAASFGRIENMGMVSGLLNEIVAAVGRTIDALIAADAELTRLAADNDALREALRRIVELADLRAGQGVIGSVAQKALRGKNA